MSYDSDPDLYDYAAPAKACGVCYDANETPDQIYIGISGLIKGPLAAPGDPPPPNGVYLLTATAGCHYITTIAPIDYDLKLGPVNTGLLVDTAAGLTFFNGQTPGICKRWFVNTLQNPAADKYYSGWAVVANPQIANGESVADLMNLIGFPPAPGTAVSARAMAGTFGVFVLARDQDMSNLKIKWDLS